MIKYELTGETKVTEHGALYRIRAVRSFGNVQARDYGGWVSGEHNLSHDGECWVYDEAQVFGRALVRDKAWVSDNARVYGDALVCENARVIDHARVFGNAMASGNAHVGGRARVYGNAWVFDDATVYDNAQVSGDVWVHCIANVYGNARISQTNDILTVGAIGSRYDWTTVYKDAKIGVRVSCGSFTGSLDEFAAMVRKTHGNNTHVQEYNALIEIARLRFADALGGGSNEKV
jgi:UDP-3-O-[3-hydroxymyristoyl] glucosamine N-acyltransferase